MELVQFWDSSDSQHQISLKAVATEKWEYDQFALTPETEAVKSKKCFSLQGAEVFSSSQNTYHIYLLQFKSTTKRDVKINKFLLVIICHLPL